MLNVACRASPRHNRKFRRTCRSCRRRQCPRRCPRPRRQRRHPHQRRQRRREVSRTR